MLFTPSVLFYSNKNDDNGDDDNESKLSGNFTSVFECTVVNLAMQGAKKVSFTACQSGKL